MNLFKIAVDCIIIGYDQRSSEFKVLLVERINPPAKGQWALPGGFYKNSTSFRESAAEILQKETGVENLYLEQLRAYSLTDISDKNRMVSVAFFALVKFDDLVPIDGKQHPTWFSLKDCPSLPFDHGRKLEDSFNVLKESIGNKPLIYNLLSEKFTINQLQRIYESLFNVVIDNRNFRKKILKMPYIEKLDELEANVSRRPGYLYRFNIDEYKETIKMF